jgi:hypothetical protein
MRGIDPFRGGVLPLILGELKLDIFFLLGNPENISKEMRIHWAKNYRRHLHLKFGKLCEYFGFDLGKGNLR